MIELAQHIEVLLLENDCVIVPGLGGFVAHYTPATRVEEENVFLPPTRIIGFNPQLKMNDGLLVQSYMSVYGTNFSDATKMVERKVEELIAALHENGKVDLLNVGEVRYTIHNSYDFIPYDNKLTTPYLYGLDVLEIRELVALEKPNAGKLIPFPAPVTTIKRERRFKIKRTYLTNAAAVAAAVVMFFFFSTPIENTEVLDGNYATLLPDELFGTIEKQSLAITPIVVKQAVGGKKTSPSKQVAKKTVVPISAKEVKVNTPVAAKANPSVETPRVATTTAQSVPVQKTYHIIIASVGTEKDAKAMVAHLIDKGFDGATAIIGDGKMRVSLQSCTSETEAYKVIAKLSQSDVYQGVWVLKK